MITDRVIPLVHNYLQIDVQRKRDNMEERERERE